MRQVSVGQERRPVSRRGVLGLGFAGTMGLPAIGRATKGEPDVSPPLVEERIVECVVWAMCVDEKLFGEISDGDFHSVEKHHHLSQRAKDFLRTICAQGAGAIATLRQVLTSEPALTARTALGAIFENSRYRMPCPIFPCPWW